MGRRDVIELWGIGKRTGARLAAHGLTTVAELAVADREAWLPGSDPPSVSQEPIDSELQVCLCQIQNRGLLLCSKINWPHFGLTRQRPQLH
jgi:hypothetical protein